MMPRMSAFGKRLDRWILHGVAVSVACFGLTATPARALPAYDGLWSVSIVTEKVIATVVTAIRSGSPAACSVMPGIPLSALQAASARAVLSESP